MITFGAIMLGGGGVALGSIAVRRAPVPVDEAMRLARDHNRRVKQQHGLPPQLLEDQFVDDGVSERDEPRPSLERTAAAALRLSLSPQLGPRGGGLVLVGEF